MSFDLDRAEAQLHIKPSVLRSVWEGNLNEYLSQACAEIRRLRADQFAADELHAKARTQMIRAEAAEARVKELEALLEKAERVCREASRFIPDESTIQWMRREVDLKAAYDAWAKEASRERT